MDAWVFLGGIFALLVIICMTPALIIYVWVNKRKARVRDLCHKLIKDHSDNLAIERTKYV